MALPADHPRCPWGADLLGWRADAECAKIRGARFREPQTGNAASSGYASRHGEFEGFMMIVA